MCSSIVIIPAIAELWMGLILFLLGRNHRELLTMWRSGGYWEAQSCPRRGEPSAGYQSPPLQWRVSILCTIVLSSLEFYNTNIRKFVSLNIMHSVALSAIFSAIGICCAQLKARKSCQLSYSAPTPHATISFFSFPPLFARRPLKCELWWFQLSSFLSFWQF